MLSSDAQVLGEKIADELVKLEPTLINPPLVGFDRVTTDFELLLTVLGIVSACCFRLVQGQERIQKVHGPPGSRRLPAWAER